jgi:hypothetical protein
MAITYSTSLGNARLSASVAAVDGGSGVGLLVIGTASLAGGSGILATIPLQKPSYTVSNKIATLQGTPLSVVATGNGTAALAELRDSSGATQISGLTVGVSGANINLGSVAISSGQTVTISSGQMQSP